jgi:hypothetical protein
MEAGREKINWTAIKIDRLLVSQYLSDRLDREGLLLNNPIAPVCERPGNTPIFSMLPTG